MQTRRLLYGVVGCKRACRRRSARRRREGWTVRDRLLNESLTRLASEAAIRLSSLVAGGDQIPFDVDADSGDDSLFYSYRPLTDRYVREREGDLRTLDAFGPARDAVAATGIATAYLEARGEQVPADPGERAPSSSPRCGMAAPSSRSTTSVCRTRSPCSRPRRAAPRRRTC